MPYRKRGWASADHQGPVPALDAQVLNVPRALPLVDLTELPVAHDLAALPEADQLELSVTLPLAGALCAGGRGCHSDSPLAGPRTRHHGRGRYLPWPGGKGRAGHRSREPLLLPICRVIGKKTGFPPPDHSLPCSVRDPCPGPHRPKQRAVIESRPYGVCQWPGCPPWITGMRRGRQAAELSQPALFIYPGTMQRHGVQAWWPS